MPFLGDTEAVATRLTWNASQKGDRSGWAAHGQAGGVGCPEGLSA